VLLTLVPCSFPQDLGIPGMFNSLLQAARLQNKSKVISRSPPTYACAEGARLLGESMFFGGF
jgi:hypothetical protein